MRIHFVTGNAGKHREASALLARLGHACVMRTLDLPELQADTLEEVARGKVAAARKIVDEPFFVDDAGLFVDALKGFPGVYSAHALKTIGVPGILKLLEGAPDRTARFEAVIGYWSPEAGERYFTGISKGVIAETARDGGLGFGFDPVFVPQGQSLTFAELPTETKNRLSHRGRALDAFAGFLAGSKPT
ncbi:MAG TPA: XTP/dITP diphosphatase [Candidatus Thermoplasmatota archaeon]|nr:XTP/dITP diphosphatase [Candidatus Thermoplasmatota archaeon]